MIKTVADIPAQELKGFLDELDRHDENIEAVNEAKAEIFGVMKGKGYPMKAVRAYRAELKADPAKRDELDAQVEMLRNAHQRAKGF